MKTVETITVYKPNWFGRKLSNIKIGFIAFYLIVCDKPHIFSNIRYTTYDGDIDTCAEISNFIAETIQEDINETEEN